VVHGARFFGIPNVEFAYFATAALVLVTLAGGWAIRGDRPEPRSRRRLVAWTAGIGIPVSVVDAAPWWGADLGGAVAIIPAFAALALAGLGVRLTWKRLLGIGALGAATFVVVAVGDWLRGPERWTHAGAFVEAMAHGDGWDVIFRKAINALILTGAALPVLVPLAVLAVWAWRRVHATPDVADYRRTVPLTGAFLAAFATLSVLGAVANDSGLGGTGMGLTLAGPALLAAAPLPRTP
jgi:hypothetical protein